MIHFEVTVIFATWPQRNYLFSFGSKSLRISDVSSVCIKNVDWTSCAAVLVRNHICDFKSFSCGALFRFWNHAYNLFKPKNCTALSSTKIVIIHCTYVPSSHWLRTNSYFWKLAQLTGYRVRYLLADNITKTSFNNCVLIVRVRK